MKLIKCRYYNYHNNYLGPTDSKKAIENNIKISILDLVTDVFVHKFSKEIRKWHTDLISLIIYVYNVYVYILR